MLQPELRTTMLNLVALNHRILVCSQHGVGLIFVLAARVRTDRFSPWGLR